MFYKRLMWLSTIHFRNLVTILSSDLLKKRDALSKELRYFLFNIRWPRRNQNVPLSPKAVPGKWPIPVVMVLTRTVYRSMLFTKKCVSTIAYFAYFKIPQSVTKFPAHESLCHQKMYILVWFGYKRKGWCQHARSVFRLYAYTRNFTVVRVHS